MSHIYIGKEARHTIALTSLEIGCIIQSMDADDCAWMLNREAINNLRDKMWKYYELVIDAERRDEEE